MKRFSVAIVPMLLLAAIPLLAHHSFGAEYDANKPITRDGRGDENRMDQSAQLLLPRCEGRQGQRR